MGVLTCNFCFYLVYTIHGFRKCPHLTVHNSLSLWFCFISLMGLISVYYEIYQAVFGNLHELSIVPYIFCFVCFLFLMYPLRKLNYKKIQITNIPFETDNKFNRLCYMPLFFLLLYTIVYVPSVILALAMDELSDVYTSQRIDGEELYEYSALSLTLIWIGRKCFNWFFAIFIFYSVWYLNKGNKRFFFLCLMFIAAVLPYFLKTIATGGRGGFIWFTAQVIIILIPLWPYFTNVFKKKIYVTGIVFVLFAASYTIAMTISRVSSSSSETPLTSIIRYFGEPFPNLGNVLWKHLKNHLMGRRMYPELFGFSDNAANTQYENFAFWESIAGVPMLNYKTIFGDFYVEFGTITTLIIIFVMGFLMSKYLEKGKLKFYKLPLYAIYLDICFTAPFWFNRRNTGDLLVIIQCLILTWGLKRLIKKTYNSF